MNVEGKGTAWTETEDFEAVPSGSQPMVTEMSFLGDLPITIVNVVRHAMTTGLEALCDVSVGEISRKDGIEPVKEEGDCLLEKEDACEREEKKLEKRYWRWR